MLATSRRQQYADAISALRDYTNIDSSEDLVANILAGQTLSAAILTGSDAKIDTLKAVVSPVIDVINGGKFTHELLNSLNEFQEVGGAPDPAANAAKEDIPRAIRFTLPLASDADRYTNLKDTGVISGDKAWTTTAEKVYSIQEAVAPPPTQDNNEASKYHSIENPQKFKTTLSVIEILNSRFGTAVRDVTGISIFSSMVPAHIMSRAVPYVNVRIRGAGRTSVSGNTKTLEGLSLLRYVKGRAPIDENTNINAMIFGAGGSETPASMELFTAPQTMVSDLPDIRNDDLFGSARPVDRFRPLMSMTSLDFDVAPAGGFMSYKTGKMSLVLHDRGRLSEVAPFVKAGFYSTVELEIEYGWSIDTSSGRLATDLEVSQNRSLQGKRVFGGRLQDDVFAQFIDSLRVIEKYSIVNSDFNFDDSGQVNINLSLAMKGGSDLDIYDITSAIPGSGARKILTETIAEIGEIIKGGGDSIKPIIGETIVGAVSSEDAFLALSDVKLKELKEVVRKLKGNTSKIGDLKNLSEKMTKLFDQQGALVKDTDAGVGDIFKRLNEGTEYFPACSEVLASPELAESNGAGLNKSLLGFQNPKYKTGSVSIARALIAFACQPLMTTGRFDEIQLIFNKFNERASFMKDVSIAAFPLDTDALQSDIKDMLKKRPKISIKNFIELIGRHVDDIAHPVYGFSSLYDDNGKLKDGKISAYDKALTDAGIKDAKFIKPRLRVSLECIPHETDREKTILRIHVNDAQANPFETYSEAIASGRSDVTRFIDLAAIEPGSRLFGVVSWKDMRSDIIAAQRKDVITKMGQQGVIKNVTSTSSTSSSAINGDTAAYQINLTGLLRADSPRKLQEFMSRSLPVIHYGSGAGLVKSISVNSINDARLSTVNIIKAQDAQGANPAASKEAGLPLLLNGTEVQVELLGCPILHFMQSVYINFGTGTSIDNIYACTGLSHKMSPGQFSTSAKFTLHTGAYGIYSSVKREFEALRGLVDIAANGPTAPQTSAPPVPKSTDITGSEINILANYASPSSFKEAFAARLAESKKLRPTKIRIWRISGKSVTQIQEAYAAPPNWFASDSIQIIFSRGPQPGQGIHEIFKAIKLNDLTCYEIDYGSSNDLWSGKDIVKAKKWTYAINENKAKEETIDVDVTKMWQA